jgi:transcriptional regulator with XRE-family HTH domain
MTQADLAGAAGVSRRWLLDLESGKPTAQIGLVLRTLQALGLVVEAQPEDEALLADLDELLRDLGGQPDD